MTHQTAAAILLLMPMAALATAQEPPTHGFGCCAAAEYPELLPERYRHLLADWQAAKDTARPRQGSLTLLEQDIDPLGAGDDLEWTVYTTTNVRAIPSIIDNTPLGQLTEGATIDATYYIVQETDEEWLGFTFESQQAYIARALAVRPHPINEQNIASFTDLPIGSEIVNRWWGVPIPYEPTDLAVIPSQYTLQVPGRVYELRQDAIDSLTTMMDAAAADGVLLYVLSPYRSGTRQRDIFLGNTLPPGGDLSQRFSAPPGHSEHQLGTTVDFAGQLGGSFIDFNTPQHNWLSANAPDYGWVQTYTLDNIEETGYIAEPWHWRYFGEPTASAGTAWTLY